jgi:hypothetical protein
MDNFLYPILQAKPIYTMRKLLTLSIALLLISASLQAQLFNKVLPVSPFTEKLSQLVENFQNNYTHIQGEALTPDEDRDIYQSTLRLPGAIQCVIYRFHSVEDTTASWQAILYTGEDFKEASKIYKNTFRQLKQTRFRQGPTQNALEGDLVTPTESLRFSTSTLRPVERTGIYKNFMAEIEMINTMDGWTVQLNLHSRKDDEKRYQ